MKKGDRIFHIQYGWGEVIGEGYTTTSVVILFDNGSEITFGSALNGLLSFTEYTLDGFTAEKPQDTWHSINKEWLDSMKTQYFIDFLAQNFEVPIRKCK